MSALNDTPPEIAFDYSAWDRWLAVIEQLTARVVLPELAWPIEEFAVDAELAVEVTFRRS